jgi:hypothetical protein
MLPILLMNAVGLWPPRSPYKDEFPDLAKHLADFEKPFVGVPGNHDGYVGYGGILNVLVPWLIDLPNFSTGSHCNRFVDRANDYIPVLVKLPFPVPMSFAPGFSWTLDCERVLAGGVSRWGRKIRVRPWRREPVGRPEARPGAAAGVGSQWVASAKQCCACCEARTWRPCLAISG